MAWKCSSHNRDSSDWASAAVLEGHAVHSNVTFPEEMEALLLTSFLYSWHNFRTQNGLPNQALHSFVHASFNFPDWVKGAAFQRKKGTQIWRPAQPARIPESTTLTESQTQVCWEGAFIRPVSLSRSAPPAVLLYSQAKPERAFHFTCSVCTSSVARVSHNREQRRGERELCSLCCCVWQYHCGVPASPSPRVVVAPSRKLKTQEDINN